MFVYPTGDPKLEDEMRAAAGEGRFGSGYPDVQRVRVKMHTLFKGLKVANSDLVQGRQEQEKAEQEAEDRFNEAAANEAKKSGKELQTLEELAAKRLHEGEHGLPIEFDVLGAEGGLEHWAHNMMESGMLFESHLKECQRVKFLNRNACSNCNYHAGCYRCYWPKTVRYWRNKEMRAKLMEGYTPAAKAAAKGKAKAAGLPVPAAGGPAEKPKGKAAGLAAKASATKAHAGKVTGS